MQTKRIKPRYDVQRMSDDLGAKGWMFTDLARVAGVSTVTVTRFFRARSPVQTPKTADKFARALGRASAGYYLIRSVRKAGVAA